MPNLAKDWPVVVLVGGFFSFVVYALIKSRQGRHPDQQPPQDAAKK